VPTEGAWVQFKKPTIEELPILDVLALSESQLKRLAGAYDTLANEELNTIQNMADDPTRHAADDAFSKVLGLPSLDNLRAELAVEPVICNRALGRDLPVVPDDQLQFELM
jgi:hypothetical protein